MPQLHGHVAGRIVLAAAAALLTAVQGVAQAQTLQVDGSQQARRCAALSEAQARLACYDAAFASPNAPALAAPAPATPPATLAAPATPASLPPAPASTPPAARFGEEEVPHKRSERAADVPKVITAIVSQATHLAQDYYRLQLDNGQTWQTIGSDWAMDFKSGSQVVISRLPLGGYVISLPGSARSVTVRRIR